MQEKRDWLHKAVRVGSLPHVQFVADSWNIVKAKNYRSQTVLHIAVLSEEEEIIEHLVNEYPELVHVPDNVRFFICFF